MQSSTTAPGSLGFFLEGEDRTTQWDVWQKVKAGEYGEILNRGHIEKVIYAVREVQRLMGDFEAAAEREDWPMSLDCLWAMEPYMRRLSWGNVWEDHLAALYNYIELCFEMQAIRVFGDSAGGYRLFKSHFWDWSEPQRFSVTLLSPATPGISSRSGCRSIEMTTPQQVVDAYIYLRDASPVANEDKEAAAETWLGLLGAVHATK